MLQSSLSLYSGSNEKASSFGYKCFERSWGCSLLLIQRLESSDRFWRINLLSGIHPTAVAFADGASALVVATLALSGSSSYMCGEAASYGSADGSTRIASCLEGRTAYSEIRVPMETAMYRIFGRC